MNIHWMKVVHIINRLMGGGAEVMVPQIHREHLRNGVDSWIVSMETGDDRGTEKVVSFGRRLPRWREPFRLRSVLQKIEEDGTIDVVHAHLTQSQMFAKHAIRGLKRRPLLVTTEHDTSNRRRNLIFGRLFDRFLYRGYDGIICISEGVEEAMAQWVPQHADRLVTITNGVDLEPLTCIEREPDPSGEARFLSVGRLVPKKNIKTAIRALSKITDRPWQYTVVGEGEQRAELEALASECGVADKIRFVGYEADVGPYYRQNEIFLFPSLWEGFGLVAVEAMAAGLVVVASDVPGLAEVVGRDKVAGLLLPPNEPDRWAEEIAKLLNDQNRLDELARGGRDRAAIFSVRNTARNYLSLYDKLISTDRADAR